MNINFNGNYQSSISQSHTFNQTPEENPSVTETKVLNPELNRELLLAIFQRSIGDGNGKDHTRNLTLLSKQHQIEGYLYYSELFNKDLTIRNFHIIDFLSILERYPKKLGNLITNLDLRGCFLNLEQFTCVIKNFPNLKSFKSDMFFNREMVHILADNCPKLKTIYLSHNEKNILNALANRYPNLTYSF